MLLIFFHAMPLRAAAAMLPATPCFHTLAARFTHTIAAMSLRHFRH